MSLDLCLVAAVFAADRFHLVPLSKTPFLLLIGWISLRLRGLRWRDVGFSAPRQWSRAIVVGVMAGVAMEALDLFVTKPLEARILGKPPDLTDFLPLVGNWKLAALGLLAAWIVAALGEELSWRGYMMNRVAEFFRRTPAGWVASLLLVNALFGYAHSNQGIAGIVQESLAGVLLGVLYLASGRNLAIPIVAHGVTDTIDVALIFSGRYPGLHG